MKHSTQMIISAQCFAIFPLSMAWMLNDKLSWFMAGILSTAAVMYVLTLKIAHRIDTAKTE